jgi:hypothetical protein
MSDGTPDYPVPHAGLSGAPGTIAPMASSGGTVERRPPDCPV